jgi:hypothetical protein
VAAGTDDLATIRERRAEVGAELDDLVGLITDRLA